MDDVKRNFGYTKFNQRRDNLQLYNFFMYRKQCTLKPVKQHNIVNLSVYKAFKHLFDENKDT